MQSGTEVFEQDARFLVPLYGPRPGDKPCPISLTTTYLPKMNGKPVNRGAVAGGLLVACMLLGAGIGAALGSLAGATALLGIAGVFAGLGSLVGLQRFRRRR